MDKRLLIGSGVYGKSNGVFRSVMETVEILKSRGWIVKIIHPKGLYEAESADPIDLGIFEPGRIRDIFDQFQPTHLHLANEGYIPLWIREMALSRGIPFTSSFTTQYHVGLRGRVSEPNVWEFIRGFHRLAARTFVPAKWLRRLLNQRGFKNLHLWPRGVNSAVFAPQERMQLLLAPVLMSVGRVVREKNLELMLDRRLPGTKVVVGGGPYLDTLKALATGRDDVVFLGDKGVDELSHWYSQADAFFFGNPNETFGNVLLEALACGTPLFGPPTPTVKQLLKSAEGCVGSVDPDILKSLEMTLAHGDRQACRAFALSMTWERATDRFEKGLVRIEKGVGRR